MPVPSVTKRDNGVAHRTLPSKETSCQRFGIDQLLSYIAPCEGNKPTHPGRQYIRWYTLEYMVEYRLEYIGH